MSEFIGAHVYGGTVILRCCECGRFIKHGDEATKTVPQFGEPSDPQFEFVHKVCPPKRSKA